MLLWVATVLLWVAIVLLLDDQTICLIVCVLDVDLVSLLMYK